jgi:hypothetical protein
MLGNSILALILNLCDISDIYIYIMHVIEDGCQNGTMRDVDSNSVV